MASAGIAARAAAVPSARRGQVFVALAAVAWSTAGVFQRGLGIDAAAQVAGRAAFATAALALFVAVTSRGHVLAACRSLGRAGLGFSVCLAVASGAFIVALNHTTVANVLFIQAISPVLAAGLARVLLGEAVSPRTTAAMALALAGVAVMIGAPGDTDPLGVGLSLVMALAFALSLVITRHRRDVSMAPATLVSQLMLVVCFAPFATHSAAPDAGDVLALAGLGAIQTSLALVFLTVGARLIPASQVAMITLLEVVLGPLWVWIAFSEQPATATLIGGAIVIAAIVVQASARPAGRPLPVR